MVVGMFPCHASLHTGQLDLVLGQWIEHFLLRHTSRLVGGSKEGDRLGLYHVREDFSVHGPGQSHLLD